MIAIRTALFVLLTAMAAQANWITHQATPVLQDIIEKRLRNIPVNDVLPPPLDPIERQSRDSKNRRYNSNTPFKLEWGQWQSEHRDFIGEREAFPFTSSDLVISGRVESAQTYLSEDHTNLYTEFKIQVDELFANRVNPSIKAGVFVIFDIEAGALRRAPNQVIGREIVGLILPEKGHRGIFFLRAVHESLDFALISGYEMGDGYILPLESKFASKDLPWTKVEQFIGSVRTPAGRTEK